MAPTADTPSLTKEWQKKVRTLIKDGKECPPKMPKMPIAGEKGVNVIDMVMFKSDYDRYKDKTEEYDDYKAKVFLLILGQCTLNMRQKIEEDDKEEYKKMEEE